MKFKIALTLTLLLSCEPIFSDTSSETTSFIVTTTQIPKGTTVPTDDDITGPNPKIYSMEIQTNISNRFASTLITSKVRNLKKTAEETTFSVILPENAFVSEFAMEIGGKIYKAYVKEKKEAKQIYDEAVSSGRSAGHVELNARNSKTFTVSVNIEPESKTIFRLTYEELLQRQIGQYELIVNIHPGQIVDDLNVQVHINESRPLTFVRTPSLRTGNEISKNDDNLEPEADIKIINSTSAVVKFSPDKHQQKHFGKLLGSRKENGLAGQFVVQYDVERDPQGGEVILLFLFLNALSVCAKILVRDGYFVHFFSPSELEPLPKHVVFVLDNSGSMMGRKIEQLNEAMQNILSELRLNDLFNIVRFSDSASVWDLNKNNFTSLSRRVKYGQLEPVLRETGLPDEVEATEDNIEKAKKVIKIVGYMGSTNIMEGLEVGLFLTKRTQEKFPNKYQPMIVFLTDGLPTEHTVHGITSTVINFKFKVNKPESHITSLNSGPNRASIFSLSFGSSADKKFLQKLSSQNLGFSRHIFEAADASLQLQDFYRKISSPLLSNVTFKYVDGVTDVTKSHYPIFFNGSELVVAGRTNDISNISLHVGGICRTGFVEFTPKREEPVSSLERLWAYLTVKQILKEKKTATNTTELTKKALDLALKYSFVTEVSSLVVVKPNRTDSVEGEHRPKAGRNRLRADSLGRAGGPQPHFLRN
ncbi:VIT and/or VWA domain containing protein [Asbolus verrucosus]|uniref:VIT and/or VWA domain containing protein n=1 Tax=Asbolus verrucosus TaxID=1661398 RepID=A0A482VW05_ASBVE|nr:VIT and/or VWA domain containing protein [Asbolus verrucosus]